MNEVDYFIKNIPPLWPKIAIAVLIGLLIGLERERKKKPGLKFFAGMRTFPLISLLGFLAALLSSITDTSVFVALISLFGLFVGISYYFAAKSGEVGATTEISFLIVFISGALVFYDYLLLASAVTVVLMTFLSLKEHFRAFVGKIKDEDIFATLKFAVLTIIILPLLPNEYFGPYDSFNFQKIWYFVIFIAGISFVGYVLFKLVGTNKGIQMLSIIGGIASSTAITVSFTNKSKEAKSVSKKLAAGAVLASSIMFPRLLIIILVINSKLGFELIIPFSVITIAGVVISFLLWRKTDSTEIDKIELNNPFKVMFALKFGLIFTVIIFVTKMAQANLGDSGIYLTSVFGGFADLDAIALSVADMTVNTVQSNVGVISIMIAATANSIVKAVIASTLGSNEMRKYSLIGFSVIICISIIFIVLGLV